MLASPIPLSMALTSLTVPTPAAPASSLVLKHADVVTVVPQGHYTYFLSASEYRPAHCLPQTPKGWVPPSIKALLNDAFLERPFLVSHHTPSPPSYFLILWSIVTAWHSGYSLFISLCPPECEVHKGKNFLLLLLPRSVSSPSKVLHVSNWGICTWESCPFTLPSSGTRACLSTTQTQALCSLDRFQHLSCPSLFLAKPSSPGPSQTLTPQKGLPPSLYSQCT